MATPEQNTLLGIQLFSPVAEQVAAQNAARTNTLLKLLTLTREEQLRRDLASQGYDKGIELAKMQATREDARWKAQDDREAARNAALDERDTKRLAALQTKETERADAVDLKQLRAEIAKTYPKYAAAATQLGEKVRPITEFKETWEGLGDLQAEMARLEQTRVKRDQDAAATAAVSELDDASAAVAEHKKALETAMKPTPEDEKYARARASEAIRKAIEMGEVSSAPKANSQAATKGLAALARGDVTEAGSLLGSELLSQYDAAFQAAMQAAPNFKSRMQQLSIAQQNYQLAQRNLATIQSDLRKAAAGNNALATKMTTRRGALQSLMSTDSGDESAPRKSRSFEEIFSAPQTSAPVAPPAAGTPYPYFADPAGGYQASVAGDQTLSNGRRVIDSYFDDPVRMRMNNKIGALMDWLQGQPQTERPVLRKYLYGRAGAPVTYGSPLMQLQGAGVALPADSDESPDF